MKPTVIALVISLLLVCCKRIPQESGRFASVNVICTASIAFYNANHGYPSRLEQLGEASLIDSTLASGRKSGYVFSYIPGKHDADGKVTGFTVLARPQKYEIGRRSYFSNETCILRFTDEDRDATENDPVAD